MVAGKKKVVIPAENHERRLIELEQKIKELKKRVDRLVQLEQSAKELKKKMDQLLRQAREHWGV